MEQNPKKVNGHGGAREGAGRPAGVPNATTLEFRQLCRKYDEEAVERLVALMRQDGDQWLALAAAKMLLQYGYGKPPNSSQELESREMPSDLDGNKLDQKY